MKKTGKKNRKDWEKELDPMVYHVTREKGTEPPFSGKYYYFDADGMYHCSNCGAMLFSSETKYDSGSGWPSFYQPAIPESITYSEDTAFGMKRTEVSCSSCGAHLGHMFDDGPKEKTGKRYCINSLALEFEEKS